MSDEIKKTVLNTLAEPIANSAKNITDKPTQNMGTTLADIWYLVFGGISQAAEKHKLKYSYALQEFENELKEKISKIPKDKLVEPDMQIVAPALEASKYCVEKEKLRKMFIKLISSSLNVDFYNYIHPSFNVILKHISIFDAKIFDIIYYNDTKEFIKLLENNINSVPQIINQLSVSLTILHNFGLILGVKYFEEHSNHVDDIFCPGNIYQHILNATYYGYRSLHDKYNGYCNIFDNNWSISILPESIDNILCIIDLTPLGKSFGKCCCE